MKKIVLWVWVLAAWCAGAQVEVNPEAEHLKQSMEGKLLRGLETYLGEKSKVLVNVQLTLAPEADLNAAAKSPGEAQAVASTEPWLDLGYVNVPGDGLTPPPTSGGPPKLRIQSTDVDVRVSDQLDDLTVQQVQQLTANMLQGMNPTVRVSKVPFPVVAKELPKPDPAKVDAPKAPEPTSFDRMLQKFGPLMPLLGALIVGFGILMAAIFSSRTLSGSVVEIASGLRSLRTSPVGMNAPEAPAPIETKPVPKLPVVPPRMREHFRNVAIMRKMLVDNPLAFTRATGDGPDDRRGLRWLLTNLSEEERGLIKRFVGPERIQALTAGSDAENEGWDASAWLQSVVETLVAREVAGGSVLERALQPEQALRFSTAPADALFQAATRLNDVAAWRVALEFLPKERIFGALRDSDAGLWQRLASGSDLEPGDLQQGAARLLAELGDGNDELSAARSAVADERKRFYANILLDPAVDSVLSKPLGDDDAFLDELSQMAPEFVELLRKKVWTPRSLRQISNEGLREAFVPLSPAQKTALLLVLPEESAARLQAFLPEGTGRTIVLDQLRKARERADATELAAATRLAREFLDFLRKQIETGRLQVTEAEPALAEAA